MCSSGSRTSGFTLIELIIVIALLGILAMIVAPLVQNCTSQTRETALKSELRSLRHQILTYELHHNGVPPTPEQLRDLLMKRTTPEGQVDPQGAYGPYLVSFPSNPYNGRVDVKPIPAGGPLAPDDSSGWLYTVDGSNFAIAANTSANDHTGLPLASY